MSEDQENTQYQQPETTPPPADLPSWVGENQGVTGDFTSAPSSVPSVSEGGIQGTEYPQPLYPGVESQQPYAQFQPTPGYQQIPGYPQPYGYPTAPVAPSKLPTEPRNYVQFLRAPAYKIWKPIVGLLSFAAVAFIVMLIIQMPLAVWAIFSGEIPLTTDQQESINAVMDLMTTPIGFLTNNLSLAAFIPLAMWWAWLFFGQRPKWMSSIQGGFRWAWFGRALLITLPVWILYFAIDYGIAYLADPVNPFGGMEWKADSLFFLLVIVLTTPLQCAGEEYLCRGFVNRTTGSLIPNKIGALLVGGLVSSTLFMFLHGAGDPWLNLFYFSFGAAGCAMTWLTGGLEASTSVHIVNNLLGLWMVPFVDRTGLFNREDGTGSPAILLGVAFLALITFILVRQARKLNLPTETAPGSLGPGSNRDTIADYGRNFG
ncbi:MAG: CPBP family intramembrane metalloprotease [Propionibacteriaceae bacterium]|jgi:membrane protease YdiL (CAAX protease family)|nr:CPBP family intramembrane metalloprotease [Propionibacteriaceae bacterium]